MVHRMIIVPSTPASTASLLYCTGFPRSMKTGRVIPSPNGRISPPVEKGVLSLRSGKSKGLKEA
jgi:hypothetical protein